MRSNHILVVESDEALREAVIGTVGVAVPAVGTGSGSEALRLLEELSPAMVLMNLQLGDMDGFTVLERIRGQLPEARVIVTSDSGNYDLVCRVTDIGVGDFLEKPYSTEDLFHMRELERSYRQEMNPPNSVISNGVLMQRLLVDMGLKLESVDNCVRSLMRELPKDHPRRKQVEKIRKEVSDLHSIVADCIAQARTTLM